MNPDFPHLFTTVLTYLGIAATFVGMAWVLRVQSTTAHFDQAVEKGITTNENSRLAEDNRMLRRALIRRYG